MKLVQGSQQGQGLVHVKDSMPLFHLLNSLPCGLDSDLTSPELQSPLTYRGVLFLEVEKLVLIHRSSKRINSRQLSLWFLQRKQCILGVTFRDDGIDVVHRNQP